MIYVVVQQTYCLNDSGSERSFNTADAFSSVRYHKIPRWLSFGVALRLRVEGCILFGSFTHWSLTFRIVVLR